MLIFRRQGLFNVFLEQLLHIALKKGLIRNAFKGFFYGFYQF